LKIRTYFLFLPVLRCFNSRRIPASRRDSEILGSKLACSSPKLIAACYVFHRNQNQAIHLTASVIVCPSKSGKPFVAYFIVNMTQNDSKIFHLEPHFNSRLQDSKNPQVVFMLNMICDYSNFQR